MKAHLNVKLNLKWISQMIILSAQFSVLLKCICNIYSCEGDICVTVSVKYWYLTVECTFYRFLTNTEMDLNPCSGMGPSPKMCTVAILRIGSIPFVCSVKISCGTNVTTDQSKWNPSGNPYPRPCTWISHSLCSIYYKVNTVSHNERNLTYWTALIFTNTAPSAVYFLVSLICVVDRWSYHLLYTSSGGHTN